jgi:tetratricopeptide (TPR) repeat protein
MRALKVLEVTVGVSHIECADVLNSLGLVKKKFALYDEAADLYDRALAICRATFKDKPHYKTGIYRNNRADIERKRGNYDAALVMYDESLLLLRATVGPMHSECADPLHAKGLVLHQLGKYPEAIEQITQALTIGDSTVFGEVSLMGAEVCIKDFLCFHFKQLIAVSP